jgi:hypothetical protein
MRNSTVLYTCNNTGFHNVTLANQYGIVVYDWSNAKALWANAHPMSSEELITKQAEMVYAQDPGLPGYAPRVWAYRNTIKVRKKEEEGVELKKKRGRESFACSCDPPDLPNPHTQALNWYSSVREKLDDPRYASWFIKFRGFNNTPYPGGQGLAQNNSFHVPACDWYDNGTAPRCSGFYRERLPLLSAAPLAIHVCSPSPASPSPRATDDQEQTPEHPGGGAAYPVDGECYTQCDCGPTNPCGEFIFDHRGGVVEGRSFRDWFL